MLGSLVDLVWRVGGSWGYAVVFVGFLRALAPFVAGSSRMPYARFLVYNVTGAVLWSAACVLVGYFAGAAWPIAEHWIGRAGLVVGLAVVVAAAWWLRHRRRRHARLRRA